MTSEQKEWLDSHKAEGYRIRGQTGGNSQWIRTGMLHADGTFEAYGAARPAVRQGSFEVGVLATREAPLPNPGFNSPNE
jgi:hypothetical protein